MKDKLIEQWKKDEKAVFSGWDFSYLKERYSVENPPWNYKSIAKKLVKKSKAVLDVETGGGEVFAFFAPFSGKAVAVEGYKPNVEVAKKKLEPLGVKILEVNNVKNLPFKDEEFDLILNRNGAYDAKEIFRILEHGGLFLTQQVESSNMKDLKEFFGVESKFKDKTLVIAEKEFREAGFKIMKAHEWEGRYVFNDVGAVVYFLKAIPWIVDNFKIEYHIDHLKKLQKKLNEEGKLVFFQKLYLILGEKI